MINVETIEKQIGVLNSEIANYKKDIDNLKISAQSKAKYIMSLLIFIVLGYISFLLWGIYVHYTWDIMEPVAFFVDYSAFLFLLSTYFLTKKRFSFERARKTLFLKFLNRSLAKKGMSVDQFSQMNRSLRNLHLYHANKLFNNRF